MNNTIDESLVLSLERTINEYYSIHDEPFLLSKLGSIFPKDDKEKSALKKILNEKNISFKKWLQEVDHNKFKIVQHDNVPVRVAVALDKNYAEMKEKINKPTQKLSNKISALERLIQAQPEEIRQRLLIPADIIEILSRK